MLTLFLMAGALAADGFAVSICRGVGTSHKWRNAIWTGVVFGSIHALMIALGWVIGDLLDVWKSAAPYVACAMLVLLGGKMLWQGAGQDQAAQNVVRPESPVMALAGLLWAGIATSVDGVAGGITLPLLGLPLWLDALVVGGVTMVLCVLGYRAGTLIGARWGKWAEVLGGFCLIAIGLHFVVGL